MIYVSGKVYISVTNHGNVRYFLAVYPARFRNVAHILTVQFIASFPSSCRKKIVKLESEALGIPHTTRTSCSNLSHIEGYLGSSLVLKIKK